MHAQECRCESSNVCRCRFRSDSSWNADRCQIAVIMSIVRMIVRRWRLRPTHVRNWLSRWHAIWLVGWQSVQIRSAQEYQMEGPRRQMCKVLLQACLAWQLEFGLAVTCVAGGSNGSNALAKTTAIGRGGAHRCTHFPKWTAANSSMRARPSNSSLNECVWCALLCEKCTSWKYGGDWICACETCN